MKINVIHPYLIQMYISWNINMLFGVRVKPQMYTSKHSASLIYILDCI